MSYIAVGVVIDLCLCRLFLCGLVLLSYVLWYYCGCWVLFREGCLGGLRVVLGLRYCVLDFGYFIIGLLGARFVSCLTLCGFRL